MGGYGSGRHGGRPIADECRKIDLAWMLRKGLAVEGRESAGRLNWNHGGNPAGSISYQTDMRSSSNARMVLSYSRGEGAERERVEQVVRLTTTRPHFGGKRWWMICPYRGVRAGKLYMPLNGDRFASREAWRLGYQSQRHASRDRPFEALFRLQKKLGCEQGWGNSVTRPKGMHRRTYERFLDEFHRLDDLCGVEMMRTIGLIEAMRSRD